MKTGIKLALVFTVVIVVIIGTDAILSIQRETSTLKEELERQGLVLTNTLAEESAEAFITGKFVHVMDYIDTVTKQEYVVYALVQDNEGTIKVHSNLSKIGTTIVDPGLNVMSSDKPYVGISHSEEGTDMVDLAVPVVVRGKRVGVAQIGYSLELLEILTAKAVNQIITVSIGSIIVGVLLAFLLGLSLTKPLVKLHQGTEEIIKGNLDYKVGTEARDEIGQLSRAFDRMTTDLKKSGEELQEYSKGLEKMVEERTMQLDEKVKEAEKAKEELEETNRKLERSNRELQDFAYIASHDLREPMRKISAFGQLLQESLKGKLDEDEEENFAFMIDGATRWP